MWFLWQIFAIWQYYFSKKNLFFGFDILNNLLTILCSMTKQIQWSQCEIQWNMPLIPITLNFFETSIRISNKLHKHEINSYLNFENCYFEMEDLIWKCISQFKNLLFQSKTLIFNYVCYYKNWIIFDLKVVIQILEINIWNVKIENSIRKCFI